MGSRSFKNSWIPLRRHNWSSLGLKSRACVWCRYLRRGHFWTLFSVMKKRWEFFIKTIKVDTPHLPLGIEEIRPNERAWRWSHFSRHISFHVWLFSYVWRINLLWCDYFICWNGNFASATLGSTFVIHTTSLPIHCLSKANLTWN